MERAVTAVAKKIEEVSNVWRASFHSKMDFDRDIPKKIKSLFSRLPRLCSPHTWSFAWWARMFPVFSVRWPRFTSPLTEVAASFGEPCKMVKKCGLEEAPNLPAREDMLLNINFTANDCVLWKAPCSMAK